MALDSKAFTRRSLLINGLSATAGVVGMGAFASPAMAQGYRYNPEHRRPVEAAMHDLEEIGSHAPSDRHQRERYDNAIRHLHEFGDRLHEGGFFDKGKLDQSIGDIQSIIDHNPMGRMAHDRLLRDVSDLRLLRQHFDDRNRYPR